MSMPHAVALNRVGIKKMLIWQKQTKEMEKIYKVGLITDLG
jgi:hypothetical protein